MSKYQKFILPCSFKSFAEHIVPEQTFLRMPKKQFVASCYSAIALNEPVTARMVLCNTDASIIVFDYDYLIEIQTSIPNKKKEWTLSACKIDVRNYLIDKEVNKAQCIIPMRLINEIFPIIGAIPSFHFYHNKTPNGESILYCQHPRNPEEKPDNFLKGIRVVNLLDMSLEEFVRENPTHIGTIEIYFFYGGILYVYDNELVEVVKEEHGLNDICRNIILEVAKLTELTGLGVYPPELGASLLAEYMEQALQEEIESSKGATYAPV